MVRFIELDVRMQEHNRRVDDANSNGWLRSSPASAKRKMTLGAVLSAVGTRLAPRTSVGEGKGIHIRPDTSATGNGARSLA